MIGSDFVEMARWRARRIWELSRDATRDFVRRLRCLRIRCELRPSDSVYDALTPEHTLLLRREHAQGLAAGSDGRWLDAAAL